MTRDMALAQIATLLDKVWESAYTQGASDGYDDGFSEGYNDCYVREVEKSV